MYDDHESLAIIICEKISLGYVAVPYIVSDESAPMLKLMEPVDAEMAASGKYPLDDAETDIVRILSETSEKAIYKRFSREKTMKAFFDKLTVEFYDNHVRPFVERKTLEAIELIAQKQMPVYIKSATYNKLYESDRLRISKDYNRTRFHFSLNGGELSYTLKILDGGQDVVLRGKHIVELIGNPAVLVIGGSIYRFQNIDSRKFRPFTQKSRITVPERSVPMYMKSYVANCIRHHYVAAYGFGIKKREVHPQPVLVVEQTVFGLSMSLFFRYDDKLYALNSPDNSTVELTQENGRYVFYKSNRDLRFESGIVETLTDMRLRQIGEDAAFEPEEGYSASPCPIIEWLNNYANELRNRSIEVEQRKMTRQYYCGPVELKMQMNEKADWFDIEASVEFEEFVIPFVRFRKHLINGIREYELPNGDIFVLPEAWFAEYAEMMPFASESGEILRLGKIHSTLLPLDLAPDAGIAERICNMHNVNVVRRGELNAQLRPYQEEGFSWMASLHENNLGGILADDMGLGKTLQTIALLAHIYAADTAQTAAPAPDMRQTDLFAGDSLPGFNNSGIAASLIVMPVSLIHNWLNELKRFAPQLKVYDYSGHNRMRSRELGKILKHYHIVVTSYGMLRNDSVFLCQYEFNYLILDESQYIKNPKSKIYKAVISLKASHRLTLSGTPIENSLTDLWAQMNFVNPGLLGSQTFFKNHFDTLITKCHDEETTDKLKRLIAPFVMRRTKEMVVKDLPPVSYQTLYCEMTAEQHEIYEREKSGARNEIFNSIENLPDRKATFIALQALTRLRLLANHPRLLDPLYEGTSGKFERVLETIENIVAEKHKLLIFSSFVRDLELIGQQLKARNLLFSKLIGSTANREEAIRAFADNDRCNIFLISLKAGGVGLNLTCADYVFVLNPWWNPAAEAQAINRAHRIGQTKNVFVYRFITSDSIEEKIARLQERKQILADSMITTDNPMQNMTPEEIRELFS